MNNTPNNFKPQDDGSVACPHRDIYCCEDCVAAHPELVDVMGIHFWIADPADRLAFMDD